MANQTINVNYTPGLFQPTLYYSQDDVGRVFQINLEGFEIPSGATVTIQATKPSGLGFTVAADSVDGNVATFTTTSVMTDESGRFPAELHIVSGNIEVGTANFLMVGERNPHPSGTTDGSQGTIIPELTLLVERVEAAAESVLGITVEAETLPAGSQATYSFDEETSTVTFGIPQGEAGAGSAGVVADAYSASQTYAVGDYVIHEGSLYRCTTAITTAESFTASHWTQVVLADDVSDLKSDLNIVESLTVIDNSITETSVITPNITTTDGMSSANGTISSSTTYCYTNRIAVQEGDVIHADVGATRWDLRLLTAFDENGNVLTAKGKDNLYRTYTVPSGVASVILTLYKSYISQGQTVKINRTTTTHDYKNIYDDVVSFNTVEKELTTRTKQTVTLTNGVMDTSGNINSSTTYKYTSKIPVKRGDIVRLFVGTTPYEYRILTAFNGDIAVSAKGDEVHSAYIVPEGINYVVLTVYAQYTNQFIVVDRSENTQIVKESGNILFGKKYVSCGDSFTDGGYTNADNISPDDYIYQEGYFVGKQIVYPREIAQRNSMDYVHLAVSGMTLAINSNGGHSASNCFLAGAYQNIPADADYVTMKFGINDLNFNTPIGTIDSDDSSTFYGAWNVALAWITENRPKAHIGIIVSNGMNDVFTYVDATIAICKKWGIPYIDEVYDAKVPLLHRINRPNVTASVIQKKLETFRISASNTHPNVVAQKFESAFIDTWMRTI